MAAANSRLAHQIQLAMIGRSVARGGLGLARAEVAISLPDWFNKHLITMDSAMAARIKVQGK